MCSDVRIRDVHLGTWMCLLWWRSETNFQKPVLSLDHGFWELNSGHQTCTASTSEPSYQPWIYFSVNTNTHLRSKSTKNPQHGSFLGVKNQNRGPAMVAMPLIPAIWGAEVGQSLSLRPAGLHKQVQGQLGLYRETSPQKTFRIFQR